MKTNRSYTIPFIALTIGLVCCFFINISLGSVAIPLSDVVNSLVGGEVTKPAWEFIIQNYRLPKAITAMMAGSGLAVSGLLMQTLFRNPLAGPFVLGISSGASLGVALFILGGTAVGFSSTLVFGKWGLIIASATGSFLVFLIILGIASKVRDIMTLLIIGFMVGSLTSSVVSVLSYFSKAEELQQFVFWSFGSLGDVSWQGIRILLYCFLVGILLAITNLKNLNALLLGDAYAKTLGVNYRKGKIIIIISTSLLAGSVTAFAGPIAFIGLAVPHLIRQIIPTSNHYILFPAVILGGAILMLVCDTIAQVPLSEYSLPINAVTALVGAPVVIWLLVRKKKLLF